jgi:hypothetical protein
MQAQGERDHAGEGDCDESDDDLQERLADPATVEQPGGRGQQIPRRSCPTGRPRGGHRRRRGCRRSGRLVLQSDRQRAEPAGHDAEQDRPERRQSAAQAGVIATSPATIPDAAPTDVACPSRKRSTTKPAEHRCGRGDRRVDPHESRSAVGSQLGTSVEAEPAEPQQAGPDHGQRHVVRAHRDLAEAQPQPDEHGEHQASHAGVDVDDRPTGEVDRHDVGLAVGGSEQRGRQPALRGRQQAAAPDHVRHREVGQGHPQPGEHHPRRELHPVGDRATDERHGDDRKRHLERDQRQLRDGAIAVVTERVDQPLGAREPELLERVGDDPAEVVRPERHRVAVEDVENADQASGSERHHHHVEDGLGPGHAPVEQGQPGDRHEQDERRAQDDEGRRRVVDGRCGVCQMASVVCSWR